MWTTTWMLLFSFIKEKFSVLVKFEVRTFEAYGAKIQSIKVETKSNAYKRIGWRGFPGVGVLRGVYFVVSINYSWNQLSARNKAAKFILWERIQNRVGEELRLLVPNTQGEVATEAPGNCFRSRLSHLIEHNARLFLARGVIGWKQGNKAGFTLLLAAPLSSPPPPLSSSLGSNTIKLALIKEPGLSSGKRWIILSTRDESGSMASLSSD